MNKCDFCPKEAIDEAEFETGNNAEVAVMAALCADHSKELEDIGYDFDTKYADRLNQMASEKLADMADYYEARS